MIESAPNRTTKQSEPDGGATDDSRTEVDWAALWKEFGFDTPDAAGFKLASDTQLEAALQPTEQSPAGDVTGHISQAVASGAIVKCQTDAGTLRGYAHVGGDR